MQPLRHRLCNRLRAAWVGMHIARQVPAGIKLHVHIRQSRLIENAPPQHLVGRALRTELRYDDERLGAPCAREINERTQAVAGPRDSLFNGSGAAVGNQPAQQRSEARGPDGRLRYESRRQLRAIVEQIAIKKGRHEQR